MRGCSQEVLNCSITTEVCVFVQLLLLITEFDCVIYSIRGTDGILTVNKEQPYWS